MFGKKEIIREVRTEHVPYNQTVHIHKAPTDDSIRLVEEYKEKIMKGIIDKVNVQDNLLNGLVMYVSHGHCPYPEGEHELFYKFSINNERIEGSCKFKAGKREDILKLLFEKIKEHIAIKIVEKFDSTILRSVPSLNY